MVTQATWTYREVTYREAAWVVQELPRPSHGNGGLSADFLQRGNVSESYRFVLLFCLSAHRMVKLTKNWRSHNAILRFPNNTFYGGELQPCADPIVINSHLKSGRPANKRLPCYIRGSKGQR